MRKYSVLMSLYIKEKPEYLELAIESMLKQTITPDEITIVKDGPITYELQCLLDLYETKYPNIFNVVGYESNHGLGYALDYGLKYCRNELVARMDADDVALVDRCEKQLKEFENNPNLDLCGGDIAEFIGTEENIVAYRKVPMTDEKIKIYMKTRCPINHMTVMFKKQSVIKSGSYQDWFWNEDYFLWIRMLQNGCVFRNTGDVLVNVRTGHDMYSRRGGKKYYESEKKIQRYMFDNQLINRYTYMLNVGKRFVLQRVLPNKLRGWVYRHFARK